MYHVHHASICANVVIGVLVVLCELHVTRVVVVGLTLGLIAHVVVVVFVVAILHRIFCIWRYTLSRVTVLCTTTATALADSAAVCASSAFAQCVCVFFETTLVFAVISDQKSPVVVRWLPHRGRRCVAASLVELSRKTHFSVAMSSLCVKPQTPREMDKKHGNSSARAALCL